MWIALIIVVGVIVVTAIPIGFDYLKERSKSLSDASMNEIKEIEKRLSVLENSIESKDEQIQKLQDDVKFFNKLLQDKTE